MQIIYKIECLEEHIPVRGNALASGDDAEDRAAEDEILERLERGDIWAWCTVKVTARIEDIDFVGVAYLGGCSYADEKGFKADGDYEQMCADARENLAEQCRTALKSARQLKRVLWFLENIV